MVIKARPFKTRIGDVEVEGFFDQSSFVFRFYGLVTFVQPIVQIGQDDYGNYAVLEEAEISNPDGFVFRLEIGVNELLESEWGYGISLRREEIRDRRLVESILRQRGIDPDSANLVVPPRQLVGVDFNPRGEVEGSSQLLDPEKSTRIVTPDESILDDRVRIAAAQRVLFLPHAIRQMSRPDRMITTREVRAVIEQGNCHRSVC